MTRKSILADVLHFRPILLEIEIGAVIQIVAIHAHIDNFGFLEHLVFLIAFVFDDLESKVRAKLFLSASLTSISPFSAAAWRPAGPWQFSQPLPTRSGVCFKPR